MNLRDYQRRFVDRCASALYQHGSALGVAPTGAGKTVMLSALVAEHGGAALVVQHREELLRQNLSTYLRYTAASPADVGEVRAGVSRWRHVTYGMVMTLRNRLEELPKVDLLVIDEAHRARAESYARLVDAVRARNPGALVFGVTATPDRGDKKGLGKVFRSVGDVIHVDELIAGGHLVAPRCLVIGETDWTDAPRTSTGEYDLRQIEADVSVEVVMDEVLRHWTREAGCRQSVFFCPGVSSAHAYAERLRMLGVEAACVDGTTPPEDRRRIFADLAAGKLQVLTNVFVATEGWDCPPVSCVVLLRPSSYKSTMVQMVGRGMRPAEGKSDCVVLDFGRSLQMHGDLTVVPRMKDAPPGEAPTKTCPSCEGIVPAAIAVCPMCGFDFQSEADAEERQKVRLREVQMREYRMMEERAARRKRQASPVWLQVSDRAMVACVSPSCGLLLTRWRGEMWLLEKDRTGPARVASRWPDDTDIAEVLDAIASRCVDRVDTAELDESFLWKMREWSDRGAAASPTMRDAVQDLHRTRGEKPPFTVSMTDAWTLLWFDRARNALRSCLRTEGRQDGKEDQRSAAQ